ncbi:uncharacterized protein LOC118187677, partial [Stegodyphus dumicola]|uniref:uncharacterized protein LOC118187677 n=1 Tax=Stegodyphus dumicola TaxID=202533 RepID=UPI0015A99F2C
PIISKAKIFLQRLWLLNLNRDELLPKKEGDEWKKFSTELKVKSKVEVERFIIIAEVEYVELNGFPDASEVAYGAAIYCKFPSRDGEVTTRLVTSKSRVSPIKRVTIPRGKFCVAVVLARLIVRVISALEISVNNVYLWTDSMIVLSCIQREPYQLKTFVANPVATFQELTNDHQWRHVSSKENPSDFIFQCLDPSKLLQNDMWWKDSLFLKNN